MEEQLLSSSYVSFRDVVGSKSTSTSVNNNTNNNENDIISTKGGKGKGETRLHNNNFTTIKDNNEKVGSNIHHDNETTITISTEAMFGDVHAESVFDNNNNNNAVVNNNNNATSSSVESTAINTNDNDDATSKKSLPITKDGGNSTTSRSDDDDGIDEDENDDTPSAAALASVDDVEDEDERSNMLYTTPNVSLLNDSLLVMKGGGSGEQGGGEMLHDIPVTPPPNVKENNIGQTQGSTKRTTLPSPTTLPVHDDNDINNNNDQKEMMYCLEVLPEEPSSQQELQVGDHVYQWRSWMGIPGVFQHHGIVMDIITEDEDEVEEENENDNIDNTNETTKINNQKRPRGRRRKLIIADFSNVDVPSSKNKKKKKAPKQQQQQQPHLPPKRQRSSGILSQEGILRTYTDTDHQSWRKVEYEANLLKRSFYRAGTCTSVKSDSIGLVLARVHFIIQHPEALPDYHVVNANCECVAFWCKTGHWSTLQASSFLELTAAGQVKSTATLAGVAASTQVVVPSSGLWGWMGYTTQVSYMSIHPFVIPALAGYACVTVGVPAIMYANARTKWKQTSQHLSDKFWGSALENPDVFAECITHWSDKR